MGAAAILLPLIPGMVSSVIQIINAIRGDPLTPAETKAKLDAISADLRRIVGDVAMVELPNKQ